MWRAREAGPTLQAGLPNQHIIEQVAARLFPHAPGLVVERVAEGVSTWVYRIGRAEEIFYLRVPWLIEGYQQITPLPPDYARRIAFASLLIGLRTLARVLSKRPEASRRHHALAALLLKACMDLNTRAASRSAAAGRPGGPARIEASTSLPNVV